jgi:hypothetical protein
VIIYNNKVLQSLTWLSLLSQHQILIGKKIKILTHVAILPAAGNLLKMGGQLSVNCYMWRTNIAQSV